MAWCPQCYDAVDVEDICRYCSRCEECCVCDALDDGSFDMDEFGEEPEDEYARRTR